MSDNIKQREDNVAIKENNVTENVATESVTEKKKKPLLERLGIIEAVNQSDEKGNVKMDEIASTEERYLEETKEDMGNNEYFKSDKGIDKLAIDKIYSKFGLSNTETNNVYLLESFIKALPDNLPAEVKRQSIINLVSASQLELSKLLKDGEKRMQVLETYQQDFSKEINDLVATNERIIKKLNERIENHKKIIEEKQNLLEDQKADVEFEIQKISNIIKFLESKE